MRFALPVVAAFLCAPLLAAVPAGAQDCDPYPVGRCGAYANENVIFCYDAAIYKAEHRYVSGTATDAVIVGTSELDALGAHPPVPLPWHDLLYARTAPVQALLADPMNAPLPSGALWQESNAAPGLQMRPLTCATFQWFAGCNPPQWMGPFGETPYPPDTLVL